MTEDKMPEKAREVYQQVGENFVALYRSFRQLYRLKPELKQGEVDMLEKSFVDLIAFGIDLDVDDALEPQDDYDNVFMEMVRVVRDRGLVFCARLLCPFRKRPLIRH